MKKQVVTKVLALAMMATLGAACSAKIEGGSLGSGSTPPPPAAPGPQAEGAEIAKLLSGSKFCGTAGDQEVKATFDNGSKVKLEQTQISQGMTVESEWDWTVSADAKIGEVKLPGFAQPIYTFEKLDADSVRFTEMQKPAMELKRCN